MTEERKMNLQFFAEDAPEQPNDGAEQSKEQPKEQPKEEPKGNPDGQPNEKALTEQLQSALVEIAKLKRSVDKATAEASDYKKKYRESLSEQEQVNLQKAEEQAKHDEEFATLKKMVRVNELTENFMDLGYSKDLARKAATAQADGDTETLLDIQKQFQAAQKKAWEAEFIKSRPEMATGAGNAPTLSKEDFDKMTMIEKSKLRRENKAEYDRLLAL